MSETVETPKAFGPNAWLIEEMFRQFRENPGSLSESWRDFFADYRPLGTPVEGAATPAAPVTKPRLEEKENGHAAVGAYRGKHGAQLEHSDCDFRARDAG